MDKLRYNSIGIQMIPELLHKKLFGARLPHHNSNVNPTYILSQLKKSIDNVQFKTTNNHFSNTASGGQSLEYPWQRVAKYLPPLKNNNVIDHLELLGRTYSTPYLKCVHSLLTIPDSLLENRPKEWSFSRGWTRYTPDGNGGHLREAVKYPLEDSVVFDIEVCMEASNNNRPTLAVALTPSAWYSWCGDTLVNLNTEATETRTIFRSIDDISIEDLIPMGHWQSSERLIVGHNVSFDRSYIREQYSIDLDETRFLDTMSLHIAVSGLNQDQKMFAIRNGNPWNSISSLNNLNDVYKLYCQTEENVDKDPRNIFVKGSLADVYRSFQPLTDYCSNDVAVTLKILKSLFPTFVERFPHPVTLLGMLEMSVMYLPVNKRTWKRYLNESTSIYEEYKGEINQTLKEIACDSCSYLQNENYLKDPWLWDLDWSTRPVAFKKSFELAKKSTKSTSTSKKDSSSSLVETLMDTAQHLKKNQSLLPGYPKWFLEFCESSRNLNKLDQVDFDTIIESNQLNISPKLRAIPKLLKLMWNGFPLYYDKVYGWGYLVPDEAQLLDDENEAHFGPMAKMLAMAKENQVEVDRLKREEGVKGIVPGCLFFKLPHKDGPNRKVGNPLGKDFISKITDGTLRPFLSTVKDLVLQQNKISYWVNSSKRILSQMIIAYDSITGDGSILPRVVVSGTVTRRAVEPTWLTASNSYADRLGSELKGIIQCPQGYCYVGADVDSQELWIAALIGDAHFSGIQGSTGLGWMTLRGDKAQGTDMHSVTAHSINISRDEAKVLNYARIYGSGPDFAARFLRQSNPGLSEEEAKAKAKKIFMETKGIRRKFTHFEGDQATIVRQWNNGTESHMFNRLEAIATSEHPETPFLRGRISRALEPSVVGYDFMTSRINWVVQSSAVDFLHILLVCMRWLMAEFAIDGRFSISIHDEIRYIVREEHKYKAALALQLSNLMARAYFTSALNLNDLPASVAFFSSIEIDQCLRKDVHQDCKTPSNPLGLSKGYGVPAGESLSIKRLVELLQNDVHLQHCHHQDKCKHAPRADRLTVTAL